MIKRLIFSAKVVNNTKCNTSNPKLLDVGCDKKELKNYLDSRIKYYGIDYPEIDLEKDKLPFPSKSFDIVCCFGVLEHLKSPYGALKDLKRVLKDNGYAFISIFNFYFIFNRLKTLFGIPLDKAFEIIPHDKHLHFPHLNDTRRFIRKEFKIDKEYYFSEFNDINLPTSWLGNLYPNLFCWELVIKCKK
jgi:SAM-dependent methyltransferase